jgi:hypothetical protein
MPDMTHDNFIDAFHNGSLRAEMPPQVAAAYLSRRLLLPFFVMPILGAGVALALIGWLVTGLLVFLVGFIVPRLIKRNAVHILVQQALSDEGVYADLLEAGVLRTDHAEPGTRKGL